MTFQHDAGGFNPVLKRLDKLKIDALIGPKHPGSICIANYKGGVGKTTITCLLGYFLAEIMKKRVLMFDIDPQCSLSLAVGFDPDEVNQTTLTIYNLVKPSKWTKIAKTNFEQYVDRVKDRLPPTNYLLLKDLLMLMIWTWRLPRVLPETAIDMWMSYFYIANR